MDLWHTREEILDPEARIEPGRWGSTVIAGGKQHQYFYREHLLELWRVTQTTVPVSRLACTFTFDDLETARKWRE